MKRKDLFVIGLICQFLIASIDTAKAGIITYDFAGTLQSSFGTLNAGTAFTGSFSYEGSQPLNNPVISFRGDYLYTSLSLTIGGTTVSDNGTGVINVYDHPGYPTDLFHVYPFALSGAFGGLTLNPGAGIQIILEDAGGTALSSLNLPSYNLTNADFHGGAFIELQSAYSAFPYSTVSTRGYLTSLSGGTVPGQAPVPEPASLCLMLLGLGVLASSKFSTRRQGRK